MRIRVLGRFISAFAILTLVLCLLPANTHIAIARPISWISDEPAPDPPKGDNDGVVLKSGSIKSKTDYATDRWGARNTVIARGGHYDLGELRMSYALMMLRYWSFWVR